MLLLGRNFIIYNELYKDNILKEIIMRRGTKFILTALFIIAIAAIYFLYPELLGFFTTKELKPVFSGNTISFNQNEDIHLFKDGWIICGAPSRFYQWNQADLNPPFTQDDLDIEGDEINIVARSENYIVTDNNRIYNTQSVPFEFVYENPDFIIQDIKEYDDYLVLLIKEKEDDPVQPYVLVKGSDFLISFDGIGNAKYISMDAYRSDVSLLTLSLDSPVPITRVFHFKNRNELYGVISLENTFYYNVYRLKNTVILVGSKDILCYNVEGELKWSVSHDSEGVFEVLANNDGLLFYFPEKSQIGDIAGNALEINEQGYSVKTFPKYLSSLSVYKSGYVALELRQNLVFLSKQGKTVRKQTLDAPADLIKYFTGKPDTLFVRTEDNVLQLYTSEKQEEDKK